MAKIVVTEYVIEKLNSLIDILYENEYFGFKIDAIAYVSEIELFIETIPQRKARPTNNSKYGKWYCRYIHSRHTQWYITFDTDGKTWLIRNVINNHTEDYPKFIKNL